MLVVAGLRDGRDERKEAAMSQGEGPRDAVSFLLAFSRRVYSEMRGDHGYPARTAFARITVLLVVLVCGGPILWGAIRTMPTPLVVLIAAVVVFRVVRWYLRRGR